MSNDLNYLWYRPMAQDEQERAANGQFGSGSSAKKASSEHGAKEKEHATHPSVGKPGNKGALHERAAGMHSIAKATYGEAQRHYAAGNKEKGDKAFKEAQAHGAKAHNLSKEAHGHTSKSDLNYGAAVRPKPTDKDIGKLQKSVLKSAVKF